MHLVFSKKGSTGAEDQSKQLVPRTFTNVLQLFMAFSHHSSGMEAGAGQHTVKERAFRWASNSHPIFVCFWRLGTPPFTTAVGRPLDGRWTRRAVKSPEPYKNWTAVGHLLQNSLSGSLSLSLRVSCGDCMRTLLPHFHWTRRRSAGQKRGHAAASMCKTSWNTLTLTQ